MMELISIAVIWSLCPSKIHLPSQIFSLLLQLHVMKSKIKNTFKVKWVKFFPHKCLLPDVILYEGVNKLTRRKHFLRQKFLLIVWDMSVCRKCKHYARGVHLFYFRFMESYWLFTAFQVILHVSIWALLILGAHLSFGSNSS